MGVRETEQEDFGDEAEETLSFCDFVINSESQENEYVSEVGKSLSSSRDSFEFSSGDHFSALSSYPVDNFMFCGKRIPYGDPAVTKKRQSPDEGCKQQEPVKSKSKGEKTTPAGKCGDKFDLFAKGVPMLATPVKSRWNLFVFGVGRFPMEMELRDMKMRQSRRNRVMTSKSKGGDEMMKASCTGKGLWRRLRTVLGF
ncbi:hypothetical protein SLEP1_g42523 [Rubroshorea leprosula]|uniref:Uncharacterized protein n=1 Tax=Rubroshorea leprosula TaxID=152421 RepID=A0AAV5LBH8_9ROSI|nr:hypothetical protein SLEP1_g42523 [Rubroshorea leprosula]